MKYWKTNFKQIKLRKKGADTCTDCLILRNEFRSIKKNKASYNNVCNKDSDSDRSDASDSDMIISDGDSNNDEDDFECTVAAMEQTIAKAKAHVRAY